MVMKNGFILDYFSKCTKQYEHMNYRVTYFSPILGTKCGTRALPRIIPRQCLYGSICT